MQDFDNYSNMKTCFRIDGWTADRDDDGMQQEKVVCFEYDPVAEDLQFEIATG